VLHLRAGLVGDLVTSRLRNTSDPELTQQARQGGVLDLDAFLLHQLLVNSLFPTVAFLVEPLEKIPVDRDLVFTN
jgi:hypothetical protein